MLTSLYFVPLASCKRIFSSGNNQVNYKLNNSEKDTLHAVLLHMFPKTDDAPGANEINAAEHFQFVISDKNLQPLKRRILIKGIVWIEETAEELYQEKFIELTDKEKESVLRDLESYRNGRRWLSYSLNYILEALLGSTAYNINTDRVGWKWLEHIPGQPQPGLSNIYGTYGYGL